MKSTLVYYTTGAPLLTSFWPCNNACLDMNFHGALLRIDWPETERKLKVRFNKELVKNPISGRKKKVNTYWRNKMIIYHKVENMHIEMLRINVGESAVNLGDLKSQDFNIKHSCIIDRIQEFHYFVLKHINNWFNFW